MGHAAIAATLHLYHIHLMRSRAYAIGSSVCALICIGIGVFETVRPHGDPFLVLVNYVLTITLLFRNAKWLRDTPA